MSHVSQRPSGSLYRGLAIPFSVFVLAALLTIALWMAYWHERDSRRRFEQMAVTNADFIEQLRLPKSRELAQKLSTILGTGVGFYFEHDGVMDSNDSWPPNLRAAIASRANNAPATFRAENFQVAIAPLSEPGRFLVLIREQATGLGLGLSGWVLVPALALTGGCSGLAIVIGRNIVRPLAKLTSWLPNLERDEGTAEPIPDRISTREDEIGRLARSMERTHDRLREEQRLRRQSERLATLGRIATSLAHEIKNPAAAIGLHADLLGKTSNRGQAESLRLIHEEVDRITDLVNQWLFVARAAPPHTRPHDLAELTENVTRRMKPMVDHAGARLTMDISKPAPVMGDSQRLEQVVRNLLLNAIQAMPHGGEIDVSILTTGQEVELSVRDSGTGFSDEALRRFGEPFFSEREGGMGIGLTLASEVIRAHGGEIEASNPAGGGAAVRIRLPAHHQQRK